MVDATLEILRKDGGTFGVQDPAAWARYAGWMRDNGLLDAADGDIDGATVTTNDYLPTA
jgi:putative hydroxymethylpyrimidine transport system substrate-binding protein